METESVHPGSGADTFGVEMLPRKEGSLWRQRLFKRNKGLVGQLHKLELQALLRLARSLGLQTLLLHVIGVEAGGSTSLLPGLRVPSCGGILVLGFSQFLLPGHLWNPTVFTVISGVTLRNSVLRTRSLRA